MQIHPLIVLAFLFIAFFFTLFAMCKALYHSWFVVTGVRSSMQTKASLLGPFALFFPSLFEENAQVHLRRLRLWLPVAIVALLTAFALKALTGQA